VTGSRKFRFALLALLALVAGYAVAVLRGTSPELFEEFVFGLFLLVAGFGGANGLEHIAGAVKARRSPPPGGSAP
jgi:hypothetical protein